MASVSFESVSKRFDAVEAVRELTLAAADGELLVLVGPSGSGKTTALRMLAGLESVSEGEIRIGERVVNRVAPRERDIAMVFQDYALYPQMTVYDNLAFALRRRKTPKERIDEQVRRAAAALELDALLERKPGQLSGGQQQRVALGRALVRDPVVFLMDEPLSNLDAKLRVQTRGEIKRLQKEIGTTTVYVTHDQVEAMTLGDRIAVMNHGRLEQVGTPAELYDEPANVFVAGFVGSPGMSFAPAGRLGLDLGAAPETIVGVRPEHARTLGGGRRPARPARRGGRVRRGARARDLHRRPPRRGHPPRAVRRGAVGGAARRPRQLRPRPRGPALLRPRERPCARPDTLASVLSIELAVATPAFLDLTFVGLECLPAPGEERFAGELLRSPGGGAITAVAAARLGLQTALVAPLGSDLGGEYVRRELEHEGVAVAGFRTKRTPETVVMPVGEERTMVTVDPGIRARAADVAALTPVAIAANLDQLDLLPNGARSYLTCGDDDARAYSGKLPSRPVGARALFLNATDALVLTGADTPEAAAERLADWVETVVITLGAERAIAMTGGHRVAVPDFETGSVVDTTGDRDLLCAAYAWADLRGAGPGERLSWAQLYSRLAMSVPTATGGAVTEERLLEEGAARGLDRPSRYA